MEEETEKVDVKKLRPLKNYEEDFGEYFVNRMSPNCSIDDRKITQDLVWHAFHILVNFDFRETIGFITNVSDILDEFEKKFGKRYNRACSDCEDKIENGEIPEKTNTDGCNGCGGCQ